MEDEFKHIENQIKIYTTLLNDFEVFIKIKEKQVQQININSNMQIVVNEIYNTTNLKQTVCSNSDKKKFGSYYINYKQIFEKHGITFVDGGTMHKNLLCFGQKSLKTPRYYYNSQKEKYLILNSLYKSVKKMILLKFELQLRYQKREFQEKDFILKRISTSTYLNEYCNEEKEKKYLLFIKEKAKKHIEKPLNTNKAFDKIAFIEQIKNYKDEEINNSNQNLVNSTNLYEKLSKFKQTQNEIQNLKNITKFQIEHDIKQLYKLNIRNVLTECPYNIYTNNKTRTKNIDKYNKILEIIDIYNNKVKQNNNNSLHSINIVKDVPKKLENINDIYFDDILNTLMDIINLEFSSEKNLTNAINSLFNEKIEKQEKEKKKLIKFRDKEKTNEKFTFSKYFHSQNLLNLEKSSKKNKIIKILK